LTTFRGLSTWAVTGGAGFIGSHIVGALRHSGDEVIAVDRFADHYDPALKEENAAPYDVRRLDLSVDPLDELVESVDGIFHLAAKPSVRSGWGADFAEYERDNIFASERLFEAASRAGTRVVFTSSSSIYGEAETYPTPEDVDGRPISPYGRTKLACERLAAAYRRDAGLDVVTLRYFTVYGPRQRPDMAFTRIATALAEGRPFELYGDGSQSRGFTYVSDAVAATLAAMENAPAGAVYNVGGGSEATMLEAIAILEEVSGRKLDLVAGGPAAGDVRRTSADTTRIRTELGWRPRVELQDGLARQWEWAALRVAAS
jgi:UDP-glucuronate 4-epimerase